MRRFNHDDSPDFEPMRGKRIRRAGNPAGNPASKRDGRKRNTLRAHRGGRG